METVKPRSFQKPMMFIWQQRPPWIWGWNCGNISVDPQNLTKMLGNVLKSVRTSIIAILLATIIVSLWSSPDFNCKSFCKSTSKWSRSTLAFTCNHTSILIIMIIVVVTISNILTGPFWSAFPHKIGLRLRHWTHATVTHTLSICPNIRQPLLYLIHSTCICRSPNMKLSKSNWGYPVMLDL